MKQLKRLLLIDDDLVCCWLNKVLLEEMQVAQEITCLNSGQEALDYLSNTSSESNPLILPDLIFLDLNLPDMRGFELLEKALKIPGCKTLTSERTILLTNSMHLPDLRKANEKKVRSYLVKPLTRTKVQEVLKGLGLYSSSGIPIAPDRLPARNRMGGMESATPTQQQPGA